MTAQVDTSRAKFLIALLLRENYDSNLHISNRKQLIRDPKVDIVVARMSARGGDVTIEDLQVLLDNVNNIHLSLDVYYQHHSKKLAQVQARAILPLSAATREKILVVMEKYRDQEGQISDELANEILVVNNMVQAVREKMVILFHTLPFNPLTPPSTPPTPMN